MNRVLENIAKKVIIDNHKKFKGLKAPERESVLRICKYIGDLIGYDTIRVETPNSDIEFTDRDNYYIEVKTVFYFRGKYGDMHNRIMKEVVDILDSKKNRFYSLFVDNYELKIISENKRLDSKNPSSIANVMFSYNHIPNNDIYKKLWTIIDEASDQLENNNKNGKKIIAIDISYYLMDALLPRKQLEEWLKSNPEIAERVDGICIFSLDHQKKGGFFYPLIISTQRIKKCVKSRVFRQPDPKFDVMFNLQTVVRSKSERKVLMDKTGRVYADSNFKKQLYFSSLELQRQDKNFTKDNRIDRIAFYLNNDYKE